MRDAVIVSAARTGLAKSWRGALNMTHGATLGGHVVAHAIARAKLDPAEVEDVLMGCALPEGATGWNIARQIALRAGCPVSVPGATINRFCSSGLQTIVLAAQRIIAGEGDIYVAGGVESLSCVQNEMNKHMFVDPWLAQHKPEIYWTMLQTAEKVALRYHISRERQDEYGVQSQQRAAAALAAGKFAEEIVPIDVTMALADKETSQILTKPVTLAADEGIRADTTYDGVAKIKPALPGGTVAAGNASQFSDGAAACVVMSAGEAAPGAARCVPRLRGRRLRARRDGHRPRVRGLEAAVAHGPSRGGHRPLGDERGVRGAGDLQPGQARDSERSPERRRRRDRRRPSLRRLGHAAHGARIAGRAPARREARRRHDVHRRRNGRGRLVRGPRLT